VVNQWTLIQLPNLPVFGSGTWPITPGSVGYYLNICLAAGSTYMPPSNDVWNAGSFMGAVGMTNYASLPVNTFFICSFVQHEPGAFCTTPMDCPFTQNYDDCLRYFQKSYDYSTAAATATAAGIRALYNVSTAALVHLGSGFVKPMAKVPTVTNYNHVTGTANSVIPYGGSTPITTSGMAGTSTTTPFYQLNASGLTQGQTCWFHYTADTGW
jgi:hypothetical protein